MDHQFWTSAVVTESRLHPLAMQLLADIDEDTVDLITTYDGTVKEPVVLRHDFRT